jgi:hypothetical protein
VLSPASVKGDRFLKRLRYREAGVPLYREAPFTLTLEELLRPL